MTKKQLAELNKLVPVKVDPKSRLGKILLSKEKPANRAKRLAKRLAKRAVRHPTMKQILACKKDLCGCVTCDSLIVLPQKGALHDSGYRMMKILALEWVPIDPKKPEGRRKAKLLGVIAWHCDVLHNIPQLDLDVRPDGVLQLFPFEREQFKIHIHADHTSSIGLRSFHLTPRNPPTAEQIAESIQGLVQAGIVTPIGQTPDGKGS